MNPFALFSSKGTELHLDQMLKHKKGFELRHYPESTVANRFFSRKIL